MKAYRLKVPAEIHAQDIDGNEIAEPGSIVFIMGDHLPPSAAYDEVPGTAFAAPYYSPEAIKNIIQDALNTGDISIPASRTEPV